jgi:hypothetical protein
MTTDVCDPGDTRTFVLDYTAHLAALGNATIDASTWDVPDELEVIADDFDTHTTSIKIKFAATKIGFNYTCYNTVTTNGGDVRRRAMVIPVRDASTFSGPSQTKTILDAIRAAMAKSATRAQLRKQIGDKTIEYMSMSELLIAETRFQQLYNQERRSERIRQGAPFLKNVHTRFLPPM